MLIAQAADLTLIDLAGYLGSPAACAAAAMLAMQYLKAEITDRYVPLVAAVVSVLLLAAAWLLGTWSPDFSDPRGLLLTVVAVVGTVVGPTGLYEIGKALLRLTGVAKPSAAVVLALMVLPAIGCTPRGYVPASDVQALIDTAGRDHDRYLAADTDRPPIEIETQRTHWAVTQRLIDAAEGATGE